jgi:hypothetical protein
MNNCAYIVNNCSYIVNNHRKHSLYGANAEEEED